MPLVPYTGIRRKALMKSYAVSFRHFLATACVVAIALALFAAPGSASNPVAGRFMRTGERRAGWGV